MDASSNPFFDAPDAPTLDLTYADVSPDVQISYGWDYVQKGDQVTIGWHDLRTDQPRRETGMVVGIDDTFFYIRTSGNGDIRAPQVGVRLLGHLIYEGGAAYSTSTAPEHRRRSERGDLVEAFDEIAALADNPFADAPAQQTLDNPFMA